MWIRPCKRSLDIAPNFTCRNTNPAPTASANSLPTFFIRYPVQNPSTTPNDSSPLWNSPPCPLRPVTASEMASSLSFSNGGRAPATGDVVVPIIVAPIFFPNFYQQLFLPFPSARLFTLTQHWFLEQQRRPDASGRHSRRANHGLSWNFV